MRMKELIVQDMRRLVKEGQSIVTAAIVARALRVPSASVRRAMGELADAGLIKRVEGARYALPHIKIRAGKVVAAVTPAIVVDVPTEIPAPPIGDPVFEDESIEDELSELDDELNDDDKLLDGDEDEDDE